MCVCCVCVGGGERKDRGEKIEVRKKEKKIKKIT